MGHVLVDQRLDEVSSRLDGRRLVWFGIRGDDAAPLSDLSGFYAAYGVTAPLMRLRSHKGMTLEESTGHRADVDVHDIDADGSPAVTALRSKIMGDLSGAPSALVTYRSSYFISDIGFAMWETTRALGMFKDRQSAFEYKPWVETELARRGIETLGWRYVADEYKARAASALRGPVVVRASRSSGGLGTKLVRDREALEAAWPENADHLVGVAEFVADALPLNVGACVFPDGTVTVHPGSVQLIGLTSCTDRDFGYCGNDFAAFAALPKSTIARIDDATRAVGSWMAEQAFVGAFGVDFLLTADRLVFAEVNPRMQGSTATASRLARRVDRPDIVIEHVAAHLGVAPGETPTLIEWAEMLPPGSNVVVHNLANEGVRRTAAHVMLEPEYDTIGVQVLPDRQVTVKPGAVLARLQVAGQVTHDGFSISPDAEKAVAQVHSAFAT